jgi:hypothetical protein
MNGQNLLATSASFKADKTTSNSTTNWREYWRVHGTSWHSLFDLHVAIVNRLQAATSWRRSS